MNNPTEFRYQIDVVYSKPAADFIQHIVIAASMDEAISKVRAFPWFGKYGGVIGAAKNVDAYRVGCFVTASCPDGI